MSPSTQQNKQRKSSSRRFNISTYVNRFSVLTAAVFVVAIGVAYTVSSRPSDNSLINSMDAAITVALTLPFPYSFSVDGRLEETGNLLLSTSPYWWVNSGGFMDLANGVGKTNQGNLPGSSRWQKLYNQNNALDTENGRQPQNIFRLLLRTKWTSTTQQIYAKINRYNLSSSPNRSESNGILLMSNYTDSDNLYYAGVRVDGYAVIKKKKAGTYYTMASAPVFTASTYNRDTNPNLLPVGTWIGLKSEVKNLPSGKVSIKLYTDIGKTGSWKLVAEVIDDGETHGGSALTAPGHGGLRTDFMDVEFDDYRLFPTL